MADFIAWPLTYNVIRRRLLNHTFGMVRNGGKKPHQGWDFEAGIGTTIYAIADGVVDHTETRGAYGTRLCTRFRFGAKTLYAYYAHLSVVSVKAGDVLKRGQPLGATGESGNARGMAVADQHLHFEIRTVPRAGFGLKGRISPLKVFGTCPLKRPAYQNFSHTQTALQSANMCMF